MFGKDRSRELPQDHGKENKEQLSRQAAFNNFCQELKDSGIIDQFSSIKLKCDANLEGRKASTDFREQQLTSELVKIVTLALGENEYLTSDFKASKTCDDIIHQGCDKLAKILVINDPLSRKHSKYDLEEAAINANPAARAAFEQFARCFNYIGAMVIKSGKDISLSAMTQATLRNIVSNFIAAKSSGENWPPSWQEFDNALKGHPDISWYTR